MDKWGGLETIGERLKWLRESKLGILTRTGMSDWLNDLPDGVRPESTSNASVKRYETGDRNIPTDYVLAVCSSAEVNLLWVLKGEGAPTEVLAESLAFQRRLEMVEPQPQEEDFQGMFWELCDRLGWDGPGRIAIELSTEASVVAAWVGGEAPIPVEALAAAASMAGESTSYISGEDWPGQRRRRDMLIAAAEMKQLSTGLRSAALKITPGVGSGEDHPHDEEGDPRPLVRQIRRDPPVKGPGEEGSLPDAG